LKQKRHEVIFQLRHQGEEVREMEGHIFDAGCKLKTVLDENHRFQEVGDTGSVRWRFVRSEIVDHNAN